MNAAPDLDDKYCPTCFIHYAAPKALFEKKNETSEHWFCPNGHHIVFSQSALQKAQAEAEKLRRERDRLRQNEAWWADKLNEERKQTRTLKRQLKTVHTRVGNGVCPCCNRSFANLQRHMAGKHPDYKAAA